MTLEKVILAGSALTEAISLASKMNDAEVQAFQKYIDKLTTSELETFEEKIIKPHTEKIDVFMKGFCPVEKTQ